jgi:hypothetical protein
MNNDAFQWIVVIELAIIILLLLLPLVRRPVV